MEAPSRSASKSEKKKKGGGFFSFFRFKGRKEKELKAKKPTEVKSDLKFQQYQEFLMQNEHHQLKEKPKYMIENSPLLNSADIRKLTEKKLQHSKSLKMQ